MIPDSNRAAALFDRALDFEPSERAAFLAGACGNDVNLRRRVEDLLLAHEAQSGFLPAVASPDAEDPRSAAANPETLSMGTPITEGAGTLIDRYKLLEKLGEGGFGAVWAAEQREPVKRRVALKIIKLGMDTGQVVARFEAERQALALMDHPNIAKVLDAGSTETGRPYFVMELVRGIPITRYCDQERLSTQARLDLFMKVCHAIQHAHQKGIIHRDIKPSNILVTLHDGVPVPKVIDFGIAKATQQELTEKTIYTQFQQFIGTPAYMSPEQAEMSGLDIDTRSDIYSLGVLLYELLTGATPFDAKELMRSGLDEMRKIIREKEPLKPSSRLTQDLETSKSSGGKERAVCIAKTAIDKDLDWIVMKCLEKDRSRRYETANGLRQDVERFLANEPVTAVAPSVLYKLQKLARRNRLTFGAAAVVAAALVVGLGTALGFYVRERAARADAVEARQEADRQRDAAEIGRKEAEQAELAESEQRRLADENARRAEEARRKEQQRRYAADMIVVQNAVRERTAELGMEVLRSHIPAPEETDLRGWEWWYLYGQLYQAERRAVLKSAQEIAMSPDGRTLAVAGDGQSESGILILSFPELKVLQTLPRPRGDMAGIWYAADGETVVVESDKVCQYDLKTGETKQHFVESTGGHIWPLKLSPNRRWTIGLYHSDDGTNELRSFHAESGEEAFVSPSFKTLSSEHTFRISPDGSLVSVTCVDAVLRLFSIPELQEVQEIPTSHNVAVAAWSPDGQLLATGCDYPYRFDLWEAKTGAHLGMLPDEEFPGSGLDICFSPDGSRVAACDWGGVISVWDVDTRECVRRFAGNPGKRIESLAFHPDSPTLACADASGFVTLWNTSEPTKSDLQRLSKDENFWHLQYSPDGQILAASNPAGAVGLFDAQTEELLDILHPPLPERGDFPRKRWTPQLAFSSDGRMLVAGNGDHTATVYNVRSRNPRLVLKGHSGPLVNVRISPDDRLIATTAEDRTLILWDAETGDRLKQIDGIVYVDFHPDPSSRLVVVCDWMSYCELMHIDTEERQIAAGGWNRFWSVTFAPDGRTVAVGMKGDLWLYGVPDLRLLKTMVPHRGPVSTVAFHPNRTTLAIPTWGGALHLWNAKVGGFVGRLPLPIDWTIAAQFSPDGNTLAVSTIAAGIQLFRAPDRDQIKQWDSQATLSIERILELDAQLDAAERHPRELRFASDPGSINEWLLLGPIPRDREKGLTFEHFSEEAALEPLADEVETLEGQAFAWKARRQSDPVIKFSNLYAAESNGAEQSFAHKSVFGVCYLVCDRALDNLIAKIARDDQAVLYLNGEEIFRDASLRTSYRLDQGEVSGVRLQKGINRLVFRVDNDGGPWAGSVHFTDAEGEPVEGIRVTLALDEEDLY